MQTDQYIQTESAIESRVLPPELKLFLGKEAYNALFKDGETSERIERLAQVIAMGWKLYDGKKYIPRKEFTQWRGGVLKEAFHRLQSVVDRQGEQLRAENQPISNGELCTIESFHRYCNFIQQGMIRDKCYVLYYYNYDVEKNSVTEWRQKKASAYEAACFQSLNSGEGLFWGHCSQWEVHMEQLPAGRTRLLSGTIEPLKFDANQVLCNYTLNMAEVEAVSQRLNYDVAPYLRNFLSKRIQLSNPTAVHFWVIDIPHLSNPRLDIHRHCSRYWARHLELSALKRAYSAANKKAFSADDILKWLSEEENKFQARYVSPALMIDETYYRDGMLSEKDTLLAAAWLRACIHLYPRVKKAFYWQYKDAQTGWMSNWLADLPQAILSALPNEYQQYPSKPVVTLRKTLTSEAHAVWRTHDGMSLNDEALPSSLQPANHDPLEIMAIHSQASFEAQEEISSYEVSREEIAALYPTFTPRELDVAVLKAKKLKRDEIAFQLGVKPSTVKELVKRMNRKKAQQEKERKVKKEAQENIY